MHSKPPDTIIKTCITAWFYREFDRHLTYGNGRSFAQPMQLTNPRLGVSYIFEHSGGTVMDFNNFSPENVH